MDSLIGWIIVVELAYIAFVLTKIPEVLLNSWTIQDFKIIVTKISDSLDRLPRS